MFSSQMADSRSGAGGKFLPNRRKQRLATTPYDRPPPSPSPRQPAKSPNWFSGVIFPSARAIASGAGKIISSVLYSDSSSSEEDEDEEDEDEDSAAEDDLVSDNDYEIPCDGVDSLNERTETKRILEKLIMQETFSREECDRLTKILKSRVMDGLMEAKKRLPASPQKMIDNEDNEIYNKAVLEAKKWFQEKKRGSISAIKPDNETCNLSPSGIEHVDSGVGSPVDVARSYMKERPPWASPTKNFELITPLTKGLFKEGTSYSVGQDSFSSSKKRSSFASGLWNIQEELRRVRSKATEDMLRTPSSKIDPTLFRVPTSTLESGEADDVVSGIGERTTELDSIRQNKQMGVLMDAGVSSDPALAALESRHNGKTSEALPSKPATLSSGNNQEPEAIRVDGECSVKFLPTTSSKTGKHHSDPHSSKTDGSPDNEATEFDGRQGVNGFSSSQASLSDGMDTGQNHEQYDKGNCEADIVSKNKSANTINLVGNCELLTEACIEVPIVTETNSIASGSQNSLGMQYEELSQEAIQASSKEMIDTMPRKQQVQKSGENPRRSRRRGK